MFPADRRYHLPSDQTCIPHRDFPSAPPSPTVSIGVTRVPLIQAFSVGTGTLHQVPDASMKPQLLTAGHHRSRTLDPSTLLRPSGLWSSEVHAFPARSSSPVFPIAILPKPRPFQGPFLSVTGSRSFVLPKPPSFQGPRLPDPFLSVTGSRYFVLQPLRSSSPSILPVPRPSAPPFLRPLRQRERRSTLSNNEAHFSSLNVCDTEKAACCSASFFESPDPCPISMSSTRTLQ